MFTHHMVNGNGGKHYIPNYLNTYMKQINGGKKLQLPVLVYQQLLHLIFHFITSRTKCDLTTKCCTECEFPPPPPRCVL